MGVKEYPLLIEGILLAIKSEEFLMKSRSLLTKYQLVTVFLDREFLNIWVKVK